MMRRGGAIAASALAIVLGGCGTGGREADVRTVANSFLTAVGERDGAAACALLTAQAKQELASSEGQPCERAIVSLRLGAPPVARVQVFITGGAALASRRRWLYLDDTGEGTGWRVSAAGCEPRPGGRPYDCELEA